MGSSETGMSMADSNVGSIVWVRRRNGSWWPGKILGPDELSASHLMSPRSGTPVKLLGREDASVDWYNLEKSKRVKSFRCGEFDDCIERAEASKGIPPKKREKYARREDAILHALELERQLLDKKYGKLEPSNSKSSKSSDGMKKEVVTSSEGLRYGNGKQLNPKAHQISKRLDSSLEEEENRGRHLHTERVKEPSLLSADVDSSGVLPRMRGLQDFGLRTAPLKRKLYSSAASNGSGKPALDDSTPALPDDDLGSESTVHANSENLMHKKEEIHEGLAEESHVKRRDRRRPLVQVLQSSEKVVFSHLQPDGGTLSLSVSGEEHQAIAKRSKSLDEKEIHPSQMEISPSKIEESNCLNPDAVLEEKASESTEDTETDSSETDSLDLDTDGDMTAFSDGVATIELEPKYLGREAQGGHGSMSSDESDDLALNDDMSHHVVPNDLVSANLEVSKWQLKGKRNNRCLTKRSVDITDTKVSRVSLHGRNLEQKGNNGCDEANFIGKNFRKQMVGYGSRGLDAVNHSVINWEELAWNDQPAEKRYLEYSNQYFNPVFVGSRRFGGRMNSMLIDVDLKVQSSYQREHVPMISLMSKLNGKAIVGHPVQIEVLENGSSDEVLVAANDFCSRSVDNDTTLPPMWRTARRTANVRVPRPHLSSTSAGDETAKHLQYVDHDRKVSFRRSNAGSYIHKANMTRKSLYHPTDRKFPRKSPKKVSTSSSQKIRTLSSIATQPKLSNDPKHDGLIKPESVPTAVACIPVKLVFSRLHEALVGRHQ